MQNFKLITEKLFPRSYQLIDGTDEIFELNFALWEYENLEKRDLIRRSAYFKSIEGIPTIHFQTCNLQNLEEIHQNSSLRTKAFFLNGKYSTGYATHSLFPYRGKFHPQMIRALLNVIGIQPGNIVLDPMSGSATLSVEANLLGINSIAVDISPLCCLMGRVKIFTLNLDSKKLDKIIKEQDKIFEKLNKQRVPDYFIKDGKDENKPYYEIALLAYLDAIGFARRSAKSLNVLFPIVLNRYISTIKNFQVAQEKLSLKLGGSKLIEGSALELPLESDSVDGVITSPPYSFAIDYVDNDRPQLEYLGYEADKLKENMIGLNGRGIGEKLELYFKMLDKVFNELIVSGDLKRLVGVLDEEKRTMDFIIPDQEEPVIIIESSYVITTSSGQGDKAKTEINIARLIKKYYPKALFVGFVDGIGWYVRKNDLKRMVGAYDDVFTFHKEELNRFKELILTVFKK